MWNSPQVQRHLYAITVGFVAGGTVGTVGWGGAQVIVPSLTANHSLAGLTQFAASGVSLTDTAARASRLLPVNSSTCGW